MGVYSKEDIIRIVREEEIEFVRLQFTDIFGMLKNVAITASQIEKAVSNQCMFDGSSIEGFVRIDESDQYLYPDLKSFRVFPWRPSHGKVARLICDVYNTDGTPFVGDPRYVLKRVIQKANDMGYDRFNVGPEAEFFLFKTDEEGKPTTQTNDEAGYFDLGPLDHGESTRREICMALEQMDFEIEASHHECAQGQHEIDFKYAEALHAADNIMTFKLAVTTLAQRNALLKNARQTGARSGELLDVWDDRLARIGARLLLARRAYVRKIQPVAAAIYDGLSAGRESFSIAMHDDGGEDGMDSGQAAARLLERLRETRYADLAAGFTTAGPHRADLLVQIRGLSARSYGSQGQQRSAVLALKLAEASVLREVTGEQPVALLDDVLSELDLSRQDYILNHIHDWQVFITCCDPGAVRRLDGGRAFRMQDGILTPDG